MRALCLCYASYLIEIIQTAYTRKSFVSQAKIRSYKRAGVNIDAANAAKREFASLLVRDGMTLNRRNAFAAIIDAGLKRFRDPVLVLKSEEPGSKQVIGFEYDRIESICFDMINHLVNDCIVCGATPLCVQDVIVCGKLDTEIIKRTVGAIARAADDQGCFLSGGETSEQPGVLPDGRYILSASIVGIIERDEIVDGSAIRASDIVIGLKSSGLHTNGYSLVRRLMADVPSLANTSIGGRAFIDALLEVHMSYERALRPLFQQKLLRGAAHITGGGIQENLDRILPGDVDANINLGTYQPQEIFSLIREVGGLDDDEMLRTFNLGTGMAIVVNPKNMPATLAILAERGFDAKIIGRMVSGTGLVHLEGSIKWVREN
jgi:phosphoribosylformylglycinamidine cyclo-ligase